MTDAALTLPDGVTISKTARACSRDLSIKEWKLLGESLRRSKAPFNGLGDWWVLGCHRDGERAKAIAKKIFPVRGRAFQTLMNYGSVARHVETSRRRRFYIQPPR